MYSYDRRADLTPPLGWPGGPCHVVQRIDQEVRNPRLKEQLIDKAEQGDKISNPDAAKIYDVEAEQGAGLVQRLLIGPHAQYRMDLRGVTVPQVRATLKTFSKLLNDWKSQKSTKYQDAAAKISRGDTIEFTEPRLRLTIVFVIQGRNAKLVTTWWEGVADPPPPRHCDLTD